MYQDIYNCICQDTKNSEYILSIMSNLQPNCCLKVDFQKVDRHAGGKWLIHVTKRRKDNQLESLKPPCRWWASIQSVLTGMSELDHPWLWRYTYFVVKFRVCTGMEKYFRIESRWVADRAPFQCKTVFAGIGLIRRYWDRFIFVKGIRRMVIRHLHIGSLLSMTGLI